MFLALPRDEFITTSVQHAGPQWVERFNQLCDRLQPRVFSTSRELPAWLRGFTGYSLWQRSNLWKRLRPRIERARPDARRFMGWCQRRRTGRDRRPR